MSAAGISMFYASTDNTTAAAEARASQPQDKTIVMTVSTWLPTRGFPCFGLNTAFKTRVVHQLRNGFNRLRSERQR
jgi:hypothetical protein